MITEAMNRTQKWGQKTVLGTLGPKDSLKEIISKKRRSQREREEDWVLELSGEGGSFGGLGFSKQSLR